jgi:hypothetical protein
MVIYMSGDVDEYLIARPCYIYLTLYCRMLLSLLYIRSQYSIQALENPTPCL